MAVNPDKCLSMFLVEKGPMTCFGVAVSGHHIETLENKNPRYHIW